MKKLGKNMKNTKQTLEAFDQNGGGGCVCTCKCSCGGNTTAMVQATNGTRNSYKSRYGKK